MESLNILRQSFNNGITKNLAFRKSQLKSLFNMLDVHENDFCEALLKDLNKSPCEAKMTEILLCKQEISTLIKNMDTWLANERVPKTFLTLTDATWIQRQPYGVALCIGAWNYPVVLTISPLSGLLAAGNCVILKPSELAVHTAKLLSELLPKYLDQSVCRVELGDGPRTSEILKSRFDYIVYTGSTAVGKLVMEAAAKHLTPVTLELGGKSPTYLDKNVDLNMAVKRIIWSKLVNCGQTCIATDYLLCHKDNKEAFVQLALKTIDEFYTSDPSKSKDYPRIINKRHYNRLMELVKQTNGNVVFGGDSNEETCYIAPTLVVLDSAKDVLMESEIFGPILPIITVESCNEAIEIINRGEKPLAVYVFSNERSVLQKFENETTSGGLVFNDCAMHFAVKGLPFGGVGNSGMGYYHGKFSIDQFSHKRAVLDKDTKEFVNNLFRYPPYNESKESWGKWGLKSDANESSGYCLIQ